MGFFDGLIDGIKPKKKNSLDTLLMEEGARLRVLEDTYRTEIDKACRVIRYNPDRRKQAKAKKHLKNAYYGLKVTIETYDYLQDVKSENDLANAMVELNSILKDISSLEGKKVRVPERTLKKRVNKMEGKLDGATGGVLRDIDAVVGESIVKDIVSGKDVDLVLGEDMNNWGEMTIEEKSIQLNDNEDLDDVVPIEINFDNSAVSKKEVHTLNKAQEDEYMDDLR